MSEVYVYSISCFIMGASIPSMLIQEAVLSLMSPETFDNNVFIP